MHRTGQTDRHKAYTIPTDEATKPHRHNISHGHWRRSCVSDSSSFRSGSCLPSQFIPRPDAASPRSSSPSLRQCEGHPLERAPTLPPARLGAVAQAWTSPTSPPQLSTRHAAVTFRQSPCTELCCTAPTSASQYHARPRNTNYESDDRHSCSAPRYNLLPMC